MPPLGWSTGVPGGSWPYTSNQGGGLPDTGFPNASGAFATSQGPAGESTTYWSGWLNTARTRVPAPGAQGVSQSIADSRFDSANGLQGTLYSHQASWPDWPDWQTEPTSMSSMAHTSQTEAASTPSTIYPLKPSSQIVRRTRRLCHRQPTSFKYSNQTAQEVQRCAHTRLRVFLYLL